MEKTKKCYEDNAGGLTIVWYDKNDKAYAAAYGLHTQVYDGKRGQYDMVEWDDYKDAEGTSMGWADASGESMYGVTLAAIVKDIDDTANVAEVAIYDGKKLTLDVEIMGFSAKKYFGVV